MQSYLLFFTSVFIATFLQAAEPVTAPRGDDIPASSQRLAVIQISAEEMRQQASKVPQAQLPAGYKLSVVAAAPLVTHPIMGCLDDRGRLFVGDAVGVNWNDKLLDANPPNRVLMLEDTDKDGAFDKSTIFADKMTFPQGACWLKGSLYVCSPPGLWKLTDSDNDGVADQREMIVGGFGYTGNAADVHGPFLHPNGRLYWCHGRKPHRVVNKDDSIVDEGTRSGIYSCNPDGSDVQWHSLIAGDNPVEVDFTPDGEVIGVMNLYYNQPRGDTIVHWLQGGVYERADQMKAIEGLPRTLEHMPVMHNFGHVAVSGCCFWRKEWSANFSPLSSGKMNGAQKSVHTPLQFLVTHFNTQRLVRMELTPEGATYKATEHEFLHLPESPDVHFTDVMEDADGSLLVLNTGGWFRIGCPASLMAKPDMLGAVYRIQSTKPESEKTLAKAGKTMPDIKDLKLAIRSLESTDPKLRLHALEWIAQNFAGDYSRDETIDSDPEIAGQLVRRMMAEPMDPVLEHMLICAARKLDALAVSDDDMRKETNPLVLRRMLHSYVIDCLVSVGFRMGIAQQHLDSSDQDLATVALRIVLDSPDADPYLAPELQKWLDQKMTPPRLKALEGFCTALITKPETQQLITAMLRHASPEVRITALNILASQSSGVDQDAWYPLLDKLLADTPTPLLLDAVKKLKSSHFDVALLAIADDTKRPLPIRLKALDSTKAIKLTGDTFGMVKGVLDDASSSAAARIQAATMLASAALDKEQQAALAPLLASIGPVELEKILPLLRKSKDGGIARTFATELAKNPAIVSQQESVYRTAFSAQPPEIFESLIRPALETAQAATDAKKRLLAPLAEKVIAKGSAQAGRLVYESGKGACIACHRIGDKGRPIGPDLSKIGAIRTERDLVESILFPSNTLARDYEAHIIETTEGETITGVIKSHTAEGLLVVDVAGQEKNVPHDSITGNTTLTTSLMPMGLDQTLPEQDLLNLVAFLRSLK